MTSPLIPDGSWEVLCVGRFCHLMPLASIEGACYTGTGKMAGVHRGYDLGTPVDTGISSNVCESHSVGWTNALYDLPVWSDPPHGKTQ